MWEILQDEYIGHEYVKIELHYDVWKETYVLYHLSVVSCSNHVHNYDIQYSAYNGEKISYTDEIHVRSLSCNYEMLITYNYYIQKSELWENIS